MLFFIFQLFSCTYTDDPFLQNMKDECSQSKISVWDCSLNRCINTTEANSLKNDFKKCASMTDKAEQKKCNEAVAKSYTGELPNDLGSYTLAETAYALSLTLAIINFASTKVKTECTSKKVFGIAALASTALELKLYFDLKNRLEDLSASYNKEATDTHNGQRDAFLYLRKEQETVLDNSKARKNYYTALGALYAAAAVVAIMEMTGVAGMKPCVIPESSANYINKHLPNNIYAAPPSSSDFPLYAMAIGAVGGFALRNSDSGFLNYFKTSKGIATISGITSIISFSLANKSGDEASQAEANIKKIDEILAKFDELTADDCHEGRDDVEVPLCYCFNEDGSRNSNRTNSGTCQKVWSRNDTNYFVPPTDYSNYLESLNTTGCITITGEYDAACRCKSITGSQGSDACLSTTAVMGFSTLGNGLGVNQATKNTYDMARGKYSDGFLNPDANYANLAVKNEAARKKLQESANNNLKKDETPISANLNLAKHIIRKTATPNLMRALSESPLNTEGLAASSRPEGAAIEEALKSFPIYYVDPKKKESTGKEESDILAHLMRQQDSTNSNGRIVTGFEKGEEYDFGNNDISSSTSTIWEIISNRYQTSGFRRLSNE